jgi:hypothetical protein
MLRYCAASRRRARRGDVVVETHERSRHIRSIPRESSTPGSSSTGVIASERSPNARSSVALPHALVHPCRTHTVSSRRRLLQVESVDGEIDPCPISGDGDGLRIDAERECPERFCIVVDEVIRVEIGSRDEEVVCLGDVREVVRVARGCVSGSDGKRLSASSCAGSPRMRRSAVTSTATRT